MNVFPLMLEESRRSGYSCLPQLTGSFLFLRIVIFLAALFFLALFAYGTPRPRTKRWKLQSSNKMGSAEMEDCNLGRSYLRVQSEGQLNGCDQS
ncbi:hypothetical protein CEXT_751141 [Caerostris extrusa]|uniref:Transmembrane protein n=1 Tax=Caerostris extrusa TaxID=172846 RepID=A0AAV4MHZ5_CAEEX|nr:hypothetical protein CEXT_751141 [Caerostris extrusa]